MSRRNRVVSTAVSSNEAGPPSPEGTTGPLDSACAEAKLNWSLLGGVLGVGLGGLAGLDHPAFGDLLLGGRSSRRGLRCLHAASAIGLGGHGLLLDQLDDRHRRVVTLAGDGLDDAGVAAVAIGVERADLREQGVHNILVADDLEHLAAVSQRAGLRVRDDLLGVGAKALGLGLGGGDAAVLEERGGQVGQNRLLMRGRPAETGTLGGLGHWSSSR